MASTNGFKTMGRCADTHPTLELGGGFLHGGSCWKPNYPDAEVLIGLDGGMEKTSQSWPWTKGVEFLYPIQDMNAPANPKSFAKMVDYIIDCLSKGEHVHVGCIGGHGRTGTVIAAVVSKVLGEVDAITWVRKNYCNRAVESVKQVDFLHQHFGIKKVSGSKSHSSSSSITHTTSRKRGYGGGGGIPKETEHSDIGGYLADLRNGSLGRHLAPQAPDLFDSPKPTTSGGRRLTGVAGKRDVWNKPKKEEKTKR